MFKSTSNHLKQTNIYEGIKMKNLFLFITLLLLFVSCNNTPTSIRLNKPAENSQAKSVQSSPAKSLESVKNNNSQLAGSIKNDSALINKAREARGK